MIYSGYALFYKDPEGFELPLTEFGIFQIYPNENKATQALSEKIAEIENILNPRVQVTKESFFRKQPKQVKSPHVSEGVRRDLMRQKSTLFVRQVKVP